MEFTTRQLKIFWIIYKHQPIGVKDIFNLLEDDISTPSLNRDLAKLKNNNLLKIEGKGPSIKYRVEIKSLINIEIPVEEYYLLDPDERTIISKFNSTLFNNLGKIDLFDKTEIEDLDKFTIIYKKNISQLSKASLKKEFERLTIELSWKSAQIEGNTYDLLDTEQLLKYNILSEKNTEEEAIMLLNHKAAIEYSNAYKSSYKKLSTGILLNFIHY